MPTPEDLREQIREARERLARLEDLQRRQDEEAWRQYQRERADAIRKAERLAPLHQSDR